MKLINRDVVDLLVFSGEGNLITKMNTLRDSQIFYNKETESYYIGVSDVAFNLDLHKFLHSEEKLSDFELAVRGYANSISVKKPTNKKVKLIGKTVSRNIDSEEDLDVGFECHNAEISDELTIGFSNIQEHNFDYIFKINLDSNNDYFKLIIK